MAPSEEKARAWAKAWLPTDGKFHGGCCGKIEHGGDCIPPRSKAYPGATKWHVVESACVEVARFVRAADADAYAATLVARGELGVRVR